MYTCITCIYILQKTCEFAQGFRCRLPFAYNTLQHGATHCNILQHTATHCNTLQHTATHCNTLQHTAFCLQHTATRCNALQRTTTHCNTVQRTTTHYNTNCHTRGLLPSIFCLLVCLHVLLPPNTPERYHVYTQNETIAWSEHVLLPPGFCLYTCIHTQETNVSCAKHPKVIYVTYICIYICIYIYM